MNNHKLITEKFLSNVWLFESMLGRFAPLIAIDQDKQKIKKILCDVYWYKDIYDLIPDELHYNNVNKVLKTVFNHHETIEEIENTI